MILPALVATAHVVIAIALVALAVLGGVVALRALPLLKTYRKVLRTQAAREEERGKLELSYYATLIKHAQAGLKAPAEFDRLLEGLEGMVKLAGIGVEVTQKQLAHREAQGASASGAPTASSKEARREAKEAAIVDTLVQKHAEALASADDLTLGEADGASGLNGVPRVTRVDYDSAGAPG